MYWQVYLHKTVLSAEQMLVRIIRRVRELHREGASVEAVTPELNFFLKDFTPGTPVERHLDQFCRLDDHDIMTSVKRWSDYPDKILAGLSRSLVERKLLKVKFQVTPFAEDLVNEKRKETAEAMGITPSEAAWFVFTGEASNTTYDPADERIQILFKDGSVRDISEVDNALIQHNLSGAVRKYYICYRG